MGALRCEGAVLLQQTSTLLDGKPDQNLPGYSGVVPLQLAAHAKSVPALQLLLDANADPIGKMRKATRQHMRVHCDTACSFQSAFPYLQLLQGAGADFAIANQDDDVPFTHTPSGQAVRIVMDAMFPNLAWRHVLARHFPEIKALQIVRQLLQSCASKVPCQEATSLSLASLCDWAAVDPITRMP